MTFFAGFVSDNDAWRQSAALNLRRRAQRLGYGDPQVKSEGPAIFLQTPSPHLPSDCGSLLDGSHRVLLVGHLRFDEAEEHARALGLPAGADSERIAIAAYRRWGTDCPARLSGDFAFAVFDLAERTLFCARDHFGVSPFYWSGDADFAFASDSALLSTPSAEASVHFVGGFLADLTEDEIGTSDSAISRLPPAHWLERRGSARHISRFWTLEPAAPPAPADVPEGFRQYFSRAVARRLSGPGLVGAMLSGGLDSSAISAIASRETPLPTLSIVYPGEADMDETRHIDAVVERCGVESMRINGSEAPPFEGVAEGISRGEAFGTLIDGGKMRRLFAAAGARGVATLLDGHGGDEIVWDGFRRALDLAREGRWLRSFAQVPGLSRVAGEDPLLLFFSIVDAAGPRTLAGRGVRRLGRIYRRRSRKGEAEALDPLRLFAPSFVRDANLQDRLEAERAERKRVGSDFDAHLAAIRSPRTAVAFETLHRAASRSGVEARFPFFDKDFAAFCLGLPSSEKLRAGWPRAVMRRAMSGYLPDSVRWRRGKTNFGPALARGLARWHGDLLGAAARDDHGVMAPFYNMDALRPLLARLRGAPDAVSTPEAADAWRAVYLFLWLGTKRVRDAKA